MMRLVLVFVACSLATSAVVQDGRIIRDGEYRFLGALMIEPQQIACETISK